jgi:hypothetical protein
VRRAVLTVTVWLWVQAASALIAPACPVCDTGMGQQVRAGIIDENFAATLVAVLLPFPILLGLVAVIHFGWPFHRQESQKPALNEAGRAKDVR